MSHPNMEQSSDLEQWLKEQRIILDLRTRRFFSDVLPTAKIIKQCYPRLVDLHNYMPKSSVVLKLKSWEIFNHKVLRKLGIHVPHSRLEKLASAAPGAIEMLFKDLISVTKCGSPRPCPMDDTRSLKSDMYKPVTKMDSPKRSLNRSLTQIIERSSSGNNQPKVHTIDVDVALLNGHVKKVTKKVVDYEHYTKVLRESSEKSGYINSIIEKTDYLESVIAEREERISELMDELSKLTVSILSMRPMLELSDDNTKISLNSHNDITNASEPNF
ncbi:uncharacterized protein LOC108114315 [Drosophila eugracilis]|uniref:uncharacterized protein LOC108114315 n=1 Tax=Drosophila eugracilis TaxID=29029 RepID=UPI0007E5F68D|nr:uncharacterized protein LOC108114315 [Drosophila eugracilis]